MWHKECLHDYRMMFDNTYMRRRIALRDRGACMRCGEVLVEEVGKHLLGKPYEVDHIVPLVDWPARDVDTLTPDGLPTFYAPWASDNLQTICGDCHRAKTSNEASLRAIGVRVVKSGGSPLLDWLGEQ